MPAVATRTSESVIRSANARVEFFWFFFIFLSGWTPVFAVRGAGRLRIGRRFCLERRTRPGEIFGNFLKDVQMNFLRFRPRFYVEVGKRVKNFSNFRRFPRASAVRFAESSCQLVSIAYRCRTATPPLSFGWPQHRHRMVRSHGFGVPSLKWYNGPDSARSGTYPDYR